MKNNTIITISRQYGSGGRLIGQKLAERLGIPFYDKELITLAAEESGFAEHLFEKNDRNITNSPTSRWTSWIRSTTSGSMP